MKLSFGALGVVVLGAMATTACGPGLSHHGKWAQAPSDATSTATLTSAPVPKELPADLPNERMPVAQWEEPTAAQPIQKTWGAAPELDPNYNPEYGF